MSNRLKQVKRGGKLLVSMSLSTMLVLGGVPTQALAEALGHQSDNDTTVVLGAAADDNTQQTEATVTDVPQADPTQTEVADVTVRQIEDPVVENFDEETLAVQEESPATEAATSEGEATAEDRQDVALTATSNSDRVQAEAATDGQVLSGWVTQDGVTRYYEPAGTMAVGWRTIGGYTYYFQSDGAMKTGWLTLGSKRYYFDASGIMQTGWLNLGKKTYYLSKKGVMQKGWKTIEGARYYFSKKGVMQKGLKKIGKKRYYFLSTGVMANGGLYKNYIIAWNGVLHKIPNKRTGNKVADARRVAKLVAKCVTPKSKLKKKGRDLARVQSAARYVAAFSSLCTYKMAGNDYYTAYGVFIAKEYTCAGSTAALGMVLECMGYKWTHVNKNKMTHQWVRLKMDGKTGYADGQVGWAGYGKHPVE